MSRRHPGGSVWSSARVARRLVDVSYPFVRGVVTYPGLPGPEIANHLTRDAAEQAYGPGVRFQMDRISMIANTGTYLDSLFHRFDGGLDLAGLPLETLAALDGVLVRLSGLRTRTIGIAELVPYDVAGRAVRPHTGWDRHRGVPRPPASRFILPRPPSSSSAPSRSAPTR